MSNHANDGPQPRLKVLNSITSESLPSGYAYLIRSSVRMPELYPLLGELLFGSSVNKKRGKGRRPNIVGMFIEDSPDNLATHLRDPRNLKEGNLDELLRNLKDKDKANNYTAAWMNTFGDWYEARKELCRIGDEDDRSGYEWWNMQIAGAGNPMAVMRFFRQVQTKPATADLNIFLLNSLSNLYRNLGLSETAAFLKTMLGRSIWSGEAGSGNTIEHKPGLFFAVMQEDVLKPSEASYLESFFDGVIQVAPCWWKDKYRFAHVHVQVLPQISRRSKDFIYKPQWDLQNLGEEDVRGWSNTNLEYISVRETDDDVTVMPENPYFNVSAEQTRWLSVPR